jgi:hypothetical protein
MNADERWFRAALEGDEPPAPAHGPTPWPAGQRGLYLRLTADAVSERRLLEA